MYKIISRYRNNFVITLIICLFIIELAPTLLRFQGYFATTRIVGIYKIIFQLAILFLIDYRKLNKRLAYLIIMLSSIFTLGLVLNPLLKTEFNWLLLKGSIYYFDRYIFIFLFALMIYSRKDKSIIISKSLKYIEYILIANAVLMVLGFLFDLKIFESYITSSRFGYDGIFNKVNEVSCIYSIYLIYLYYCVFITKTKHWSLLLTIALISLLLGTKTILLLFSLLFVFHFFFVIKNNKPLKIIVLVLLSAFIYFFEKIINFLFGLFPFWDQLQKKYGLLTLLLSKRDILLNDTINYVSQKWNGINYIIGGGYYTKSFAISQMDGPDLFFFFGGLGVIIYFLMFGMVFLKKNNTILNGLIIIVLISGLLSGGLLMSGMSMVLLFLVSCIFDKNFILKQSKI